MPLLCMTNAVEAADLTMTPSAGEVPGRGPLSSSSKKPWPGGLPDNLSSLLYRWSLGFRHTLTVGSHQSPLRSRKNRQQQQQVSKGKQVYCPKCSTLAASALSRTLEVIHHFACRLLPGVSQEVPPAANSALCCPVSR
jgi:hypothetical protein